MEITGKIIAVLDARSGTSQRTGNVWMTQQYVIETQEQYPKRCVFEVFGQDKIGQYNIQIGKAYTVSFDIDAREYNGKWYNSVKAWNVVPLDVPLTQAPVQQPQTAPPPQPEVQQSIQFAEPAPEPLFNGGNNEDDGTLPF